MWPVYQNWLQKFPNPGSTPEPYHLLCFKILLLIEWSVCKASGARRYSSENGFLPGVGLVLRIITKMLSRAIPRAAITMMTSLNISSSISISTILPTTDHPVHESSEIFARTLFSRSFVKIKPSRNGKSTLSFIDIGKSCLSRECFTSLICISILYAKIKFSRKVPNLKYLSHMRQVIL